MPPDADGLVDILIPVYGLLPLEDEQETAEQSRLIQHLAAHEAVHASIHHNGDEPFDLHRREEFGYASMNFVSLASEQIEEHLAEYLGSQVTGREVDQSASNVEASIDAWQETLATELPAIPEDDPDDFQRGMLVTFNAPHILWKTLAYLAAVLRTEDGFRPVPSEIAALGGWRQHIEPWWERYLELLGEIPMTVDVNIAATDEVVREMGRPRGSRVEQYGSSSGDAQVLEVRPADYTRAGNFLGPHDHDDPTNQPHPPVTPRQRALPA